MKYPVFCLAVASMILSFVMTPDLFAATRTVNLSDYGVRPGGKNLSVRIGKAIARAAAGTAPADTLVVRFEKGRYELHPDVKNTRELYISNHDQTNPKNVGIFIDGLQNIIIDGNGSELLFHGRMLPVALRKCRTLTLRNFSIDFPNPQIAQVEIVANDTLAGLITYRPAEWVKCDVSKSGEFIVSGDGWSYRPIAGIAFEKKTRHMVYNTSDIGVGTTDVKRSGDLFTAPWRNKALIPGTIVAMRSYDRPCPGIFIDSCVNTSIENVTVHYAEGMGLIAQNCTDIKLHRFNVSLKGDHDPRYFTTQADATHFSACRGTIVSTGGLYENMMDDAINVHGTYLKLIGRGKDTLKGRYMHPQSYGFSWGMPGDTVSLIRSATMEPSPETYVIKQIRPCDSPADTGAKEFEITLDRPLSADIDLDACDWGVENLSATPAVIFNDNIVRNNRARGALFSTPRPVVVEGNFFDHTSGSAIVLCGDCNGWYETGACRDVVIRKNLFKNALTNLFQFTNAVISVYPEIPDLKNQQLYFHSGISITENEFDTFDAPLLYARSVDGLIFLDNRVRFNTDYPPLHWNNAPVWLERVNNARIQATSARNDGR